MNHLAYIGTRDNKISATASEAIVNGLCADGGLYIPKEIPKIDKTLEQLATLSYQDLAYEVLKLYVDFTEDELRHCINSAYDDKFDTKAIVPLVKKDDALFLELFHGRTLAFKDMALSILPYLMKTAVKRVGMEKEIVILTATSGDTGKAALEGFADVDGLRIMVFFPEDGVSPVQKLQMTTQEGKNTSVIGILGNFDDAQSAVKTIFTDAALQKELADAGFVFSSANSINIGRLIPQIVYYFSAYFQAVSMKEIAMGDKLNVSVPTGNFGDLLAGWYAKSMGLPIGEFICASNENKVLFDFFESKGKYDRNRSFHITVSPSMDILISSNLERLLSHSLGQEVTKNAMDSLGEKGAYAVEMTETHIHGQFATKEETFASIKTLFDKTNYVMDTHTAVGYAAYKKYQTATGDMTPTVVVSTASPYKFTKDVMMALEKAKADDDDFLLMKQLETLSGVMIPKTIDHLEQREVLHKTVVAKEEITNTVRGFLK
ncbi:MAG: threonine synthase [Bacillota bacterium]